MFSSILESHRRLTDGMAFQTSPEGIADRCASREAITVLQDYILGQERAGRAQDALKCLVLVHGDPVKMPAREFWKAMRIDDPEAKEIILQELMQTFERYLRDRI